MKNLLIVATSALCVLIAIAVPLPDQDVQIVQIPLEGNKELDILSLPENNEGRLTERNKRTIGVLRQLFPELSKKVEQVIEEKIQLILPIILRNVGPLLLRGGLGGLSGGGGTTNNDDDDDFDDDDSESTGSDTSVSNRDGSTSTREGAGGRKVSISLPTFSPDTDDEEEDDETTTNGSSSSSSSSNDNKDESNTIKSTDQTQMTNSNGGESSIDFAALSERLETINRVVRNTAAQAKAQPVAESKSDKSDSTDSNTIATAVNDKEDTSSAASDATESKTPIDAIDELSIDDDENRNKRFLSFGFGGSNGGSGGSGNFLFDIIRRTADRAARAAGTIYRVAAGTESFDLDLNKQATRSTDDDSDIDHNNDDNDSTSRKLSAGNDNGLVGGSAGTEQTDESENAPAGEATVAKNADGYTEGIPGPVTRLFVLANRGLANLIQDLILRIAQTSERVVNFKARLITSLI